MAQSPSPLQAAIIGSGPAGFFCADYLLRLAKPCAVSMFERRPAPFGLVRDAVAPDRMNIRNATRAFARIAEKPGFSFFGNVQVGHDISVEELRRCFDAVIITTGAPQARRLDVQGEDLPECYSAVSLAGWYNASVDSATLRPDLSHPAAVIIGAGNAALDVARVLATPPDCFAATDISSAALETLKTSRIRDVHVVARRGPLQARFTPEELEHLAAIPDCQILVHREEMLADDSADRLCAAYRKVMDGQGLRGDAERRIHLRFHLTPFGILGDEQVSGALFLDANETPLHIPCGLAVVSAGCVGTAIEGVPFDAARSVIPNAAGRVLNGDAVVLGLYVAGWCKRGADGVIGTNKPCCRETVQCVLDDRHQLRHGNNADAAAKLLKERGVRAVAYDDWLKIDRAEQRQGALSGKPRERFSDKEAMLAVLTQDVP